MRIPENNLFKRMQFSFAIHTCAVCGYEACSFYDLTTKFPKDKTSKKGYMIKCRLCYNEYIRNWNKNNPQYTKAMQEKDKPFIKYRKRKYDAKYRFRDKLQRHTKAYAHILKEFDKKFRKFYKVKEIDLALPFDNVIKSYTYFTGILYDLITDYLERRGLDFELYFYPYDSKDRAFYFYIKIK